MKQFEITHEMEASKGLRFANYIIDILAVYAILIVLAFGYGVVATLLGQSIDAMSNAENWKYNLIFCVLYFLYCTALESFGGRTLGKLITGTMVVTEHGEKPGTANRGTHALPPHPVRQLQLFGTSGLARQDFGHARRQETHLPIAKKRSHRIR